MRFAPYSRLEASPLVRGDALRSDAAQGSEAMP